jgi:glycosyltransferase 2 family protein
MGKVIKGLVGLSLSAGLLWLAFRNTNWAEVQSEVSLIRWWPVVVLIPILITHFYLRAMRWQLILPDRDGVPKPGAGQLFDAIAVGNLASYLLPFRIGEFVRPVALKVWNGFPVATAFVSVIVERIFDLSAVLLTFSVVVTLVAGMPDLIYQGAATLGVLAGALLVGMIVSAIAPEMIRTLAHMLCRPLPQGLSRFALGTLEDVLAGARGIRTVGRLGAVVALTALVWATCYAQFYALMCLFPGEPTVLMAVTVAITVALSLAPPAALPGFVGVYQFGCTVGFALFAYPPSRAVAFSIITHLIFYGYYLVGGTIALMRNDTSLRELLNAARNK